MTLLLLDTNAYLRFAKRVKPLLGEPFGNKGYTLTILAAVEEEFSRSPRLRERFPWFVEAEFATERLAKQFRFSPAERAELAAATSVMRESVLSDPGRFKNPPSAVDCRVLAFGLIRNAIVVTDDLSMHVLAAEFELPVMHGHDVLKRMLSAKKINKAQVREIYDMLAANGDLPATWERDRDVLFPRIFKREAEGAVLQ